MQDLTFAGLSQLESILQCEKKVLVSAHEEQQTGNHDLVFIYICMDTRDHLNNILVCRASNVAEFVEFFSEYVKDVGKLEDRVRNMIEDRIIKPHQAVVIFKLDDNTFVDCIGDITVFF